MARKSNGWVKIYSRLLEEELTHAQFRFWVGSIILANPPKNKNGGVVDLSVRSIAKLLHMSHMEVWRCKKALAARGMIELLPKGFLIKKYLYYQGKSVTSEIQNEKSDIPTPSVTSELLNVTSELQNPKSVTSELLNVTSPDSVLPHKKEEDIYKEEKKYPPTPLSPIKPGHKFFQELSILQGIKGYPFKLKVDEAHLVELQGDFPGVPLLAVVKDLKAYFTDHPITAKSNPRLKLRNFCEGKKKYMANGGGQGPNPAKKGGLPTYEELQKGWGL